MLSEDAYPHLARIRTLEALSKQDSHGAWQWRLERAQSYVADYAAKHGPPAESLTIKEIEQGARSPLDAFLGIDRFQPGRGGTFGGPAPASAPPAK